LATGTRHVFFCCGVDFTRNKRYVLDKSDLTVDKSDLIRLGTFTSTQINS